MQASSQPVSRFSHRPTLRVGIVGATGLVGDLMRRCLLERAFPVESLRLFASSRSVGRTLPWQGTPCAVEDAATADFTGLDIVFFSAGGDATWQTSAT